MIGMDNMQEILWNFLVKIRFFLLSFFKYRVRQIYIFFLENALKKTTEYFLKFLFYLKVQYFRLIMENNFIQMAASAGHEVAFTIGPIFKHIIDCVQLYFTNGFTNIPSIVSGFRRNTYLWRHPSNKKSAI